MNKFEFAENIHVTQTSRNVISVYFTGVKAGWEINILQRADAHHDSKFCDRKLEKEHLDEITEAKGLVFDFGDDYDVMQGKFDPRRALGEIRPEYVVDNYFDEIVIDNAEFLAPYAKRFVLMSKGNHENDVLKNNSIDLTSNTIHRLNSDHGGHVFQGCYGGYIRFMFDSGKSNSVIEKYFHGASLAMSKALVHKQAAIYPDADIIANGHAHDAWYVPVVREKLSQRGEVTRSIQHQFRTSTYKNDYGDGGDGWAVERGNPPSVLGAVWVKFYFKNGRIETDIRQLVR